MANQTKITVQQGVDLTASPYTVSKYPRFVVNMGTSITGVTVDDLTSAIEQTAANAAAAQEARDAAETYAGDASDSAQAAKTSETIATQQAGAAATSATNAANSATAANTAKTAAEAARDAANTAKTGAEAARDAAATSAGNAATSAGNAANSATLAGDAQAAAEAARDAALDAQTAAELAEANAKTSENTAADHATAAANSAAESAASAIDSEGSATNATTEADRAKAEADRAQSVVDAALDAEDIAPFVKLYKSKTEAEADVVNRVVDETVLVWNESASAYGWYKVVTDGATKSLELDEAETRLISVNNIRPDSLGNVQVTIPGGNPSLWLGEVTLFPYDNTGTIGYSGILLADGRELNRVDYPDLWSAIEAGLIPSVTEAAWQAGSNQFYSTGNGTTTFRLPNLLQGQAFRAPEAGEDDAEKIQDQVPYITSVNGVLPDVTTGAIVLTRSGLGLGSMADQNANNVAITGGTATFSTLALTTALSIANGGTGAKTVDAAKTNFGLDRFSQNSTESLVRAPNGSVYLAIKNDSWGVWDATANDWVALPITRGGTGALTAAAARTNLQLGSAATYNIGTSGGTIPLLNTSNSWTGTQYILTGGLQVGSQNTANTGIELGSMTTKMASFIDFHCSGTGNDFDGRIYAAEGSSATGQAYMEYVAGQHKFKNGNVQADGGLVQVMGRSYPAVELITGLVDVNTNGSRVVLENDGAVGLAIYFSKNATNDGRTSYYFSRGQDATQYVVPGQGGLAPTGTSRRASLGSNMSVVGQGWTNVGGQWTNTPMGTGTQTVYGSLFTQCTQGLNHGDTAENNPSNIWWQQRFYDTNNRIYTRINTNTGPWADWAQITTSAVSDESVKTKEGELDVEVSLSNINRMDFWNFVFNADKTVRDMETGEELEVDPPKRRGVISQQIMDIDPQYVKKVGELWHLDQTPMLLDGLAAIKALTQRDENNKARITALESEVEELKALVQQLINKETN